MADDIPLDGHHLLRETYLDRPDVLAAAVTTVLMDLHTAGVSKGTPPDWASLRVTIEEHGDLYAARLHVSGVHHESGKPSAVFGRSVESLLAAELASLRERNTRG